MWCWLVLLNNNICKSWIKLKETRTPGPRFNIKMTSYQYRKSHCGDKTILRPSYLHNGISYTGKTTSLYWIKALVIYWIVCLSLASTESMSKTQRAWSCNQVVGRTFKWIIMWFSIVSHGTLFTPHMRYCLVVAEVEVVAMAVNVVVVILVLVVVVEVAT